MTRTQTLNYMQRISILLESSPSELYIKLYNKLLESLAFLKSKGNEIATTFKKIKLLNESDLISISMYINQLIGSNEYNFNSKTRKREAVIKRQILHTIYMDNSKLSLDKIGEIIGNKSHATVIHSHITIDNLISTDRRFKETFFEIINRFDFEYKKYNNER